MARNAEQQKAYDAFFAEYGVYPIDGLGDDDPAPVVLTAEQILDGQNVSKRTEALNYLKNTDWYAQRKAETGKEIPTDVLSKRAQARLDASD